MTEHAGRTERAFGAGKETALFVALGLAVRLGVAIWAASRFPPADDGSFYHVVAQRIAHGQGYTWAWPDGAVTYAAHYPVGYPALVGLGYALFGAHAVVAMFLNAVVGALGVGAVHRIALRFGVVRAARVGGLLAAFDPGLVFYTPALMTEGFVASLLAIAGAVALWAGGALARGRWLSSVVVLGLVFGACTLVRPQCLVLAPLFGLFAVPADASRTLRATAGALTTAIAVLCCAPWTARNCARMERCVFVSANGGWNLLIGTARQGGGAWVSVDEIGVPLECREVFGEADKDVCFGRAGLRRIADAPLQWLALAPAKLATTFDFSGAPGHYLHASNPTVFGDRSKIALGAVELVFDRLVCGLALVAMARAPGARTAWRRRWAIGALPFVLLPWVWIALLCLVIGVLLLGRGLVREPALGLASAVVATTAMTHAIFFGAGRYSLVCAALLGAAAAGAWRSASDLLLFDRFLTRRTRAGDTSGSGDPGNAAD